MSREQELACDEAVIESGHSCHDYAAFLLDSARDLNASHLFACAMAGSGARSLKLRFANLLDASPRRALGRRLAVSMALCAALAIGLAMVRPVWSQNEKASQKEKASENEKEVYRVGGDVLPPTVLTKVDPEYTQHARAAKISGPVYLTMVISPEGKAENIEVTSGLDPGLDLNAVDAISQWTFQPATKEGKAVATVAHVQVNYRLL
jgi:TonB family protein